MQQFLLLFRGGDPGSAGVPAEAARQQWARWVGELRRDGAFVHGEPLQGPAGTLLGPGKRRLSALGDAPVQAVSGYLAVRAADLDAAERLAAGCPVLEHGGMVEVRPSWVVNGATS
jgi:hypothetical protein